MRTIACVLKTGWWRNKHKVVEYTADHVRWLAKQVARHVTVPHEFVCLSDVAIPGVKRIPLKDNLPGWWSKMELFRELESAFYIDLDTVITRNIDHMVSAEHDFTVLRNLSSSDANRIGSGLLAWSGDKSYLYHEFMKEPRRHMKQCTIPSRWGDQGFIQAHHKTFERFQDRWPGHVAGFKATVRDNGMNNNVRIVCFNGDPKPWHLDAEWIPKC